jgi:hypothetical protein
MKLTAELNHEKHEIEIKRDGEKVFAEIDGRKYELEASEPEPNVFLLKKDGKIYEIFVSPRQNPGEPFHARLKAREFEIALTDPKRLRGAGTDAEHGDGLA